MKDRVGEEEGKVRSTAEPLLGTLEELYFRRNETLGVDQRRASQRAPIEFRAETANFKLLN